MAYTIEPFDPESPSLRLAASIYARVWGRQVVHSIEFVQAHSTRPNFHGALACNGEKPVGMAFGTRSEDGQWWHDQVARHCGKHNPALQNAWVVVELAVLDGWRRQGVGGALLDAVVAAQPLKNLLLSTQEHNDTARQFYERRGWTYLHDGFVFPGGVTPFVIMHRALP